MEFKVGDVVNWCGLKGVISSIEKGLLIVYFEKLCWSFLPDGRHLTEHIEPSLKLIERPKQKVKKYKVLFKNPFGEWQLTSSYYEKIKDFDSGYVYDDKHILPQTQIEV